MIWYYYIAGSSFLNVTIVMRINVIETYLAHDQKIEVQILYPHRFLLNSHKSYIRSILTLNPSGGMEDTTHLNCVGVMP